MPVVSRTLKPAEATSINSEGASTDEERDNAILQHEADFHPGGNEDSGYLDPSSGNYLSFQEYKITFHMNSNGKRNTYMNYIPRIRSSKVPYKVLGTDDFMITKAETYSSDSNSGKLFSIRDKADGYSEIFYLHVGSTAVNEYLIEGLEVVVTNGVQLTCRVLGTRVDNPVVILTMRRILNVI